MAQWFDMEEVGKKKKDDAAEPEQLKVKLKILMDRPQNIKNCGLVICSHLVSYLTKEYPFLLLLDCRSFFECYSLATSSLEIH